MTRPTRAKFEFRVPSFCILRRESERPTTKLFLSSHLESRHEVLFHLELGPYLSCAWIERVACRGKEEKMPQVLSGIVTKAGVMAKTITMTVERRLTHPKLLKVRCAPQTTR
jgi:hypothetical protein